MSGELNLKCRAPADIGLHPDLTTVLFENAVDDGQAKAGTLSHLLCRVKRIENMVKLMFRDAMPVIPDGQLRLFVLFVLSRPNFHTSAGIHGIDGIKHQIQKTLLQLVHITVHQNGLGTKIDAHGNIHQLHFVADEPNHGGNHVIEVDILA